MISLKGKNIGVVLGSGGARGLAHIGVLEGLEAHGYKISYIAGCSMGALVGAVYASGNLQKLKQWMIDLDFWDVFRLMDFTFNSQGFIKGERVFEEIGQFLSKGNIESLQIPYCAIATDLKNKTEVVFDKGNLYQAVRSSIAIPTVLQPMQIGDKKYIDGGVINPLPVNRLPKNQVDGIVAVNLNSKKPYLPPKGFEKQEKTKAGEEKMGGAELIKNKLSEWLTKDRQKSKEMGFFDLLNNSFDLTQDRLAEFMIEKYSPDLLVEISREACGTMEFYKAEEMIALGRQTLEEMLNEK